MRTGTDRGRGVRGVAAGLVVLAGLACGGPAMAQAREGEPGPMTRAQTIDALKALGASCVVVEITAKTHQGESPQSDRSSWGSWSGEGSWQNRDWSSLITQERPGEFGGYVLAPDLVLVSDPGLDERFVESIRVRDGDATIDATVDRYFIGQGAMLLRLAAPLGRAKPLSFSPDRPRPYVTGSFYETDGRWVVGTGWSSGGSSGLSVGDDGEARTAGGYGVVVDATGVPVGALMGNDRPADDSWKGSPLDWPALSLAQHDAAEKKVGETLDASVLRTSLRLRSPRQAGDSRMSMAWRGMGNDSGQMTEWHGSSILMDPTTLIVLARLERKDTARLESIRIFTPSGEAVEAEFVGTLRDFGGFVARLKAPAPGTVPVVDSGAPLRTLVGPLLLRSEVSVVGETRVRYINRARIPGLVRGWRRQLSPMITAQEERYSWMGDGSLPSINFLHDLEGRLVAIPLPRRESVAERGTAGNDRYMYSSRSMENFLLPIAYAREALAGGSQSLDQDNRPLTEAEENRLAWLGVEFQPLDEDLARANDVVSQSRGGQFGAIVTFIYEGSPAAKAGVEVGDVLLRVTAAGQPKPIEIKIEDGGMYGFDFSAMFAQMDQMPVEFMDQIPAPWGNAENALTRTLTDLGFGTPYSVELVREGKVLTKEFNVEEGPAHYESAKRFKSEAGGFTARDLTFEVRRFTQMSPEDPGVVVSKVERGERAAIAGLKPFEIITAIDDKPLRNVGELEAAIAKGGEFKLAVKRLSEGRVVKLRVEAEKPAKTE